MWPNLQKVLYIINTCSIFIGPKKWGSYEIHSVCLSIFPLVQSVFSRTAHLIFINSCTKLGSHLTRKVMEPDFLKDSWARMTQNEVFPVFLKIGLWNFSIFWVKLQQQKVLKMTYGFFGSKISVWNFSGFFWMNLQWYKGLKLAQRIFFFFFGGGPCAEVCGQKDVEREFFELHNKPVHSVFLTFCMKLTSIKLENWVKLFWQNSWVSLVKKTQKSFLDGFEIFWKTK